MQCDRLAPRTQRKAIDSTPLHPVRFRDDISTETAWLYGFRLGAVYTTQKTRGTQEFDVDKIIIHYGYDDHLLDNDIALIKLEERAVFTETVRPICFPDKGFRLPYDKFTNLKCWITGWGSINAERNKWPEHLQGVAIPLVSRWDRQKRFSTHRCAVKTCHIFRRQHSCVPGSKLVGFGSVLGLAD